LRQFALTVTSSGASTILSASLHRHRALLGSVEIHGTPQRNRKSCAFQRTPFALVGLSVFVETVLIRVGITIADSIGEGSATLGDPTL
jgi:hypothetical protein